MALVSSPAKRICTAVQPYLLQEFFAFFGLGIHRRQISCPHTQNALRKKENLTHDVKEYPEETQDKVSSTNILLSQPSFNAKLLTA
jgi:hypothetical protein